MNLRGLRRQFWSFKFKMNNPEIDKNGTKRWYNDNGEIHREDGPAVEFINGHKEWYINDKLHREDGPAVNRLWCYEWWVNGKRHRLDGPAVDYANGDKYWYVDDKLHREDGPAVEYVSGYKEWWVNGVLININSLVDRLSNPNYNLKEWEINCIKYYELL